MAALLFAAFVSDVALAQTSAPACRAQFDLVRLAHPLHRVVKRMSAGEPVTIVAIGSSSTAGASASSPDATYPSRLTVELTRLFPGRIFRVLNRGIGGEEIKDMRKRFDHDVIALKPDLVLWQLGTNALIREHPLIDEGASIRDGINEIKQAQADVILIDPQFAPKVIVKTNAMRAVDVIAMIAKREDVGLFRRYELMRRWHIIDGLAFSDFISADGLHLNDWSYACIAKALAAAIADAIVAKTQLDTVSQAKNR